MLDGYYLLHGLDHLVQRLRALKSRKGAEMNGLTLGFWDSADQSLQWIGRSAAWLLLRRHSTRDESALCAATGGAPTEYGQ